jgi:hypothetical protein
MNVVQRIDMRKLCLCLAGLCLVAACSKKSDQTSDDRKVSPIEELANRAATADSASALAPLLEAKGFRIASIRRVPAQLSGRRATAAVYRSADGTRGGVLYMQRATTEEGVTWHWYFADGAPDSVQVLEINGDGLWDARVFMSGGTTRDFIQGETFTFMTDREARFAMNGAASAGESWKAFDGDTATAWRAPQGAYLDIPLPMGAGAGELSVRSGAGKIELFAGDTKVQDVALQGLDEFQLVRLAPELQQAPSIRVVVGGPEKTGAISELEIR